MNAVIYARHKEKQELEQQIEDCKKYAKRNNYTVISTYKDINGREQFEKMIEDSSKKSFQAVIVHSFDRFARNRYDSSHYKYKLKKNSVMVFSTKENIEDNASGIFIESILEGMNEYYSIKLEEKKRKIINLIEEL